MYSDIFNCHCFHRLPLYKRKKLCAVPTLEAPPKLAGEAPSNTTGNQILATIMRRDMLSEALTLDLSILSADVFQQ